MLLGVHQNKKGLSLTACTVDMRPQKLKEPGGLYVVITLAYGNHVHRRIYIVNIVYIYMYIYIYAHMHYSNSYAYTYVFAFNTHMFNIYTYILYTILYIYICIHTLHYITLHYITKINYINTLHT